LLKVDLVTRPTRDPVRPTGKTLLRFEFDELAEAEHAAKRSEAAARVPVKKGTFAWLPRFDGLGLSL
jgi:hypothetical protein